MGKQLKIDGRKKLDGILITDLVNLRYFTGSTGIALATKKEKYFLFILDM